MVVRIKKEQRGSTKKTRQNGSARAILSHPSFFPENVLPEMISNYLNLYFFSLFFFPTNLKTIWNENCLNIFVCSIA